MSRLNAIRVKNSTPKKFEYKLSDGNGLFLRVRESGSKSWLFCFRLPGDRRVMRMTLGSVEDLSLKDAREMVPALRKLVSKGIDPRSERAATKTKNSQAITMETLFESWIEFVKIGGQSSPTWTKRHFDRWRLHLKKPLAALLVKDVTRAHLAIALDAMTRKGIKEETRKALTTLNLMLDYGLTRHIIEQNPARMLKPKDFAASANRSRDRVLLLPELRELWKALDEAIVQYDGVAKSSVMNQVTATAIKLLILTGARRGEIAAMRWDEFNFEKRAWSLPSTKTKNKQSHTIYFSKLAIDLLHELKLLTGHSEYVFNTGRNTSHIHTDSLTTALQRLRRANESLAGIKPFTIHDIRRAVATAWGEHLKVNPHVIERMLNHQPVNKLVAIYQRAVYADEQKSAWLSWGEMVEHQIANELGNIVNISKVINL